MTLNPDQQPRRERVLREPRLHPPTVRPGELAHARRVAALAGPAPHVLLWRLPGLGLPRGRPRLGDPGGRDAGCEVRRDGRAAPLERSTGERCDTVDSRRPGTPSPHPSSRSGSTSTSWGACTTRRGASPTIASTWRASTTATISAQPALPARDKLTWFLERHGVTLPSGAVRVLTGLRVLGYVFNPVSFFYCYEADESLALVVAEVNNTFGETHCYVLDHLRPAGHAVQADADKVFHVSPFSGDAGALPLHARPAGRDLRGAHRRRRAGRHAPGRHPHPAPPSFHLGRARPGAAALPAHADAGHRPIHWHALKLWRKKARFFPKPAPPPPGEDGDERAIALPGESRESEVRAQPDGWRDGSRRTWCWAACSRLLRDGSSSSCRTRAASRSVPAARPRRAWSCTIHGSSGDCSSVATWEAASRSWPTSGTPPTCRH